MAKKVTLNIGRTLSQDFQIGGKGGAKLINIESGEKVELRSGNTAGFVDLEVYNIKANNAQFRRVHFKSETVNIGVPQY